MSRVTIKVPKQQTHALSNSPPILFQQKSQKGFDSEPRGIITQGRSPCPHKRNMVGKKEGLEENDLMATANLFYDEKSMAGGCF
jgi:hypothetical protein